MVRVSIRVPSMGFFPPTFCLSSYPILFILPSRYFFAIGLSPYLAFDAHTTHSYCTTKQYYSSCSPHPWALTTSGSPFHGILPCCHNSYYHSSSFLFVRHYYRNPRLFLLLFLLICLSPERTPASLHHSNTTHCCLTVVFSTLVIVQRAYPSRRRDHNTTLHCYCLLNSNPDCPVHGPAAEVPPAAVRLCSRPTRRAELICEPRDYLYVEEWNLWQHLWGTACT